MTKTVHKFAGKWRPVNQLQPAYDPTLEPTLAELRAENKQLKAERTQYPFNVAVAARAELRECQVQNERLRTALDHIRLLLTNAPGDTARREAINLAAHALDRDKDG